MKSCTWMKDSGYTPISSSAPPPSSRLYSRSTLSGALIAKCDSTWRTLRMAQMRQCLVCYHSCNGCMCSLIQARACCRATSTDWQAAKQGHVVHEANAPVQLPGTHLPMRPRLMAARTAWVAGKKRSQCPSSRNSPCAQQNYRLRLLPHTNARIEACVDTRLHVRAQPLSCVRRQMHTISFAKSAISSAWPPVSPIGFSHRTALPCSSIVSTVSCTVHKQGHAVLICGSLCNLS